MRLILLCLIFILHSFFCFGQPLDSTNIKNKPSSCFDKYTINKIFPSAYLIEFCVAESYYPELINTHIIVKEKNIHTVMAARPDIFSYLKRKSKRTYVIFIDTLFYGKKGLFYDLYFNARLGVIGHELAHISTYNHKSFPGLVGYGIQYLFNRKKLEHQTDELAISHGLGWQLYDYAQIAFNPVKVGEKYANYKKKYYYSPQQLEKLIP